MPVAAKIRNQRPAQQVRFQSWSGWPTVILPSLCRCVGAHSRRFFHCKIGISNDPIRRWRDAYRPKGWHRMDVIYQSSSHRHVCKVERALIGRFFERDDELSYWYYNEVDGGGGPKPRNGPYFVYLVSAKRHARIG